MVFCWNRPAWDLHLVCIECIYGIEGVNWNVSAESISSGPSPRLPKETICIQIRICESMKIIVCVMQIHYNSHTVFDRLPGMGSGRGQCPVRSPAHLLPFHRESRISWVGKYRGNRYRRLSHWYLLIICMQNVSRLLFNLNWSLWLCILLYKFCNRQSRILHKLHYHRFLHLLMLQHSEMPDCPMCLFHYCKQAAHSYQTTCNKKQF